MKKRLVCRNCNNDLKGTKFKYKAFCSIECYRYFNLKKNIKQSLKKFPNDSDYGECKICGLRSNQITSTHLIFHNINLKEIISENFTYTYEIFKSSRGHYNCYDDQTGKLLRSSFEIYFCELLKENNIKYEIEKRYPNSNLISDFYLPDYDVWIEIAGLMDNKEYFNKMKFKERTFNALIILPEEIDAFFEDKKYEIK